MLASQGLISLESGIGLIFGANIGTCVTAVISAVGRPREAVQAACVHVIFNLGGVLLWMFFIHQFAEIIRAVSPVSEDLQGAERLAANTPLLEEKDPLDETAPQPPADSPMNHVPDAIGATSVADSLAP